MPAGAHVRLRSLDGAPVTALLFTADPARAAEVMHVSTQLTEVAQGTPRTMLWSGPVSGIDSVTTYRPARLVLPPGMWLELQDTQGVDILIAIDGGELEVRSPDGTVTVLGPDRKPEERLGLVKLDADHAGAIVADESVTLQNLSDVPVAIVVIAVERTGDEASSDASVVAD